MKHHFKNVCTGTYNPLTGNHFHDGELCPICENSLSPFYQGMTMHLEEDWFPDDI